MTPNTNTNSTIVAYKGKSSFSAGAFYAPYIPLQMSNVNMILYTIEKTKWGGFKIVDNTKQPYTKFSTRYGIDMSDFKRKNTDVYIYGTLNFKEFLKGLKMPISWTNYSTNTIANNVTTYGYIPFGIAPPTVSATPVRIYNVIKTNNNNFVITSKFTHNWRNWRMNFREFVKDFNYGRQ